MKFLFMERDAALPATLRWWLLGLFVLHWMLGASLGLSVDEAHYALYAAHPALSYFDHPPLVGWIQWPLVALHAPTAVLRVLPGLLWLGTVVQVYRVTLLLAAWCSPQVSAAQAGSWAVWALLLAPLMHVLGIGLLPDTLLMLLSVTLMRHTLVLMQAQLQVPDRWRPWLWLGCLLGLAGLSKYTAIFSALAVAVCLLGVHGVALLGRARLWLALLLAVALVSPVLVWNAQNHWVSFLYQANHGAGGPWQVQAVLRFLLLQVLAYGALIFWGLVGVWRVPSPWRWSAAFFVIPFTLLAYMAGGGSSLPHWTAPAWVTLAPFAGLALASLRARWWLRGVALVQLLACVALPLLLVSAGMPFMDGKVASVQSSDPPNPFADLHGWDDAGARARVLAQRYGVDAVAVQNWTLASRMGWYALPLKVHVLEDRFDQFDLWDGKLPVGGKALLVDWSQLPYVTPLGAHGFARCDAVDRLPVRRFGYLVATFDFYVCTGWSGHPQPVLKPASAELP